MVYLQEVVAHFVVNLQLQVNHPLLVGDRRLAFLWSQVVYYDLGRDTCQLQIVGEKFSVGLQLKVVTVGDLTAAIKHPHHFVLLIENLQFVWTVLTQPCLESTLEACGEAGVLPPVVFECFL